MRVRSNKGRKVTLAALIIVAFGVFCLSIVGPPGGSEPGMGSAQLVSMEQLPDYSELCAPEEGSAIAAMAAEFEENRLLTPSSVYAADTVEINRPPARMIRDTYPIYSSVAVDPVRDEVVLQDTNLFSIVVFNRLENTPPTAAAAVPKRVIIGPDTKNEYNNGLYVDLGNGETYSVAMDTADAIFTFRGGAREIPSRCDS
jgi:hypothetical protein